MKPPMGLFKMIFIPFLAKSSDHSLADEKRLGTSSSIVCQDVS